MDLSKPKPPHVNLSTRWKARRERGLGDDSAFRKTQKRRDGQHPLTEQQREMAAKFLPLARKLAKPLKLMFSHLSDEFESAACMALVEAARSFDPRRNIRFATFAKFRIRGALVDVGRCMGLSGYEDDPENSPDLVTLTPFNYEHGQVLVANEAPKVGAEFEDADAVEQWLRKLPKKHASVCRLYYLYGKTHSEIGEEVGCSQSEITRLHKQALMLLSNPYDDEGKANRMSWRKSRARRVPDPARVPDREAAVA